MRRLLLLFLFFPVVLFGQKRQKAIIDSFKAATDVRHVAGVISKYPDSRVEHMQVADSGEYVTIVVRVHLSDGIITELSPLPTAKINTENIDIGRLSIVTIPLVYFPFTEPLTPLAISQIRIDDFAAAMLETVTIPSVFFPYPDPLTLLTLSQIRIDGVIAAIMKTLPLPPPPELVLDPEPLTPLAPVKIAIEHFSAGKLHTVTVPPFEEERIPVAEMHLSANGYSLLEKLEGFSPEPYSLGDGGLTIGFGFFIPDGQANKWDKGITWEEAEIMIRQKMPTYEDQVKRYINVPLTQEEFDALIMIAYNLGGFSKATSIVNDVNSYADFDQLKKDWMRFVHSKAPGVMKGLMNRRRDEMQVRADANYQADRKIQILKNRK